MRRAVAVIVIALVAAGCAGSVYNPHPRLAYYDEAEYAPYRLPGSGAISGEVLGSLGPARNRPVELRPVTSHSIEWVQRRVLRTELLDPPDPRTVEFVRQTTTDSDGRFVFTDLPAGDYFITSKTASLQGFLALGRANVQSGEHKSDVSVERCQHEMLVPPTARCRALLLE